ncbi:MBL fold metallo-hydrolase [Jiella sp. MQZ9-1]|uniref:MBL fold metallo-hydrolase n=1 Tax=Jiella flava TaxID=2816857 RepID=A0A939JVM9_9HYPH|nr:MBL fold metallo-hydrolase [Jiella flava]MBO0664385.1 MBL fold metallo-hydrolase [Jiella flava]MCD2473020.1 MBL fold metallo-hydrolase [Jiella flava]
MTQLSAQIIPVTPFQQNCCILFDADDKVGVVIDPGGEADHIFAAVKELGIDLTAIWLTHGHLDHAGGAMDLKSLAGVPIVGPHRDDQMLLESIEEQAMMFGAGTGMKNCAPDRWLEEGDSLTVGSHVFEVFHTPGHAPGHVIFFHRAARFAHLGDVLFAGSIGRTDLPGGDHATLLRSIEDKVLPLGDDVGFLCGHGPGSRIGDERRTNPFLR